MPAGERDYTVAVTCPLKLIQGSMHMKRVDNNLQLRQRLEEITEGNIPTKHPELIEELKSEFDHNIVLLSNQNVMDSTEDCFLLAMKKILSAEDLSKLKAKGIENNVEQWIQQGLLLLHEDYVINS